MQNLSTIIETNLAQLTKLNQLHQSTIVLMEAIETNLSRIYEINPHFDTNVCDVSRFQDGNDIDLLNFDKICDWIATVEPKKQHDTYEYYIFESVDTFHDSLKYELNKLLFNSDNVISEKIVSIRLELEKMKFEPILISRIETEKGLLTIYTHNDNEVVSYLNGNHIMTHEWFSYHNDNHIERMYNAVCLGIVETI